MKISNIKYQISKISREARSCFARHIKNQIFLIFNLTLLSILPLSAFADEGHPEDTPHTEEAVTIDPVFVIVLIIALAIGGLILWKFVLRSPKPPASTQPATPTPQAQEKTVSQSGENDGSQKNA